MAGGGRELRWGCGEGREVDRWPWRASSELQRGGGMELASRVIGPALSGRRLRGVECTVACCDSPATATTSPLPLTIPASLGASTSARALCTCLLLPSTPSCLSLSPRSHIRPRPRRRASVLALPRTRRRHVGLAIDPPWRERGATEEEQQRQPTAPWMPLVGRELPKANTRTPRLYLLAVWRPSGPFPAP